MTILIQRNESEMWSASNLLKTHGVNSLRLINAYASGHHSIIDSDKGMLPV